MRAYAVEIIAVNQDTGREVDFYEVIAFPLSSEGRSGAVDESVREAGAVAQVKIKYPQLKGVHAKWSIFISETEGREDKKFLPLPLDL